MIEICEDIVKKYVDSGRIPGATFGYIEQGNEEYGFYGYGQLVPNKWKVNADTIYDMASCTKVVCTTTMILKLVEEKLINIEDSVKKHLPEFKYKDVTIKNLLTHTSGLPGDDKKYRECKNKAELISFIYSLKLNNEPNKKVDYSDFGYILLGLIIERYKGNIEEYAKELIFKPLSMNDSMYNAYLYGRKNDCACTEVHPERGLLQGVVHDGKANILQGLSGNAGLFSNVKDIGKFVKCMLNDGCPILKKETIDSLKRSYTQGLNLSRSLGWIFSDKTSSCGNQVSHHSLYHTGFSGTSIYIDYDRQVGIIILTNRVHPSREDSKSILEMRKEIHNSILKEYDKTA